MVQIVETKQIGETKSAVERLKTM